MKQEWVILIYKIPSQPTRLRAQIWRHLQRIGALYLQDSVSIVPATSELAENMQWIADEIHELGGEAVVFRATTTTPRHEERVLHRFVEASRTEAARIRETLEALERLLGSVASPEELAACDDELRRIRQAALKLRRRTHVAVREEEALQRRVHGVRDRLDRLALRATLRR
jgi:uncharacterized protein Yka (UPF0111/DUF47 family)